MGEYAHLGADAPQNWGGRDRRDLGASPASLIGDF